MYSDVPWRLIRSLSRKKHRDKTGLTVAEGPSVVLAALEAGVELRAVVFTEEFAGSEKAGVLRQAMEDHGRFGRLFVVPKELYSKMSDTKTPQGVLALLRFPFRFTRGGTQAHLGTRLGHCGRGYPGSWQCGHADKNRRVRRGNQGDIVRPKRRSLFAKKP